MDIHLLKDQSAGGAWIMILGCPLPEKHELKNPAKGLSGPSFATCAACEHQLGKDVGTLNADGTYDGVEVFPELLKCGRL